MQRMALHWQILVAMVLGAGCGLGLNATSGDRVTERPITHPAGTIQLVGMRRGVPVPAGEVWSLDTPERIFIQLRPQQQQIRRVVVGDIRLVERLRTAAAEPWPNVPAGQIARTVVPTLDALEQADPVAYALFQQHGRSWARRLGDWSQLAGDLFLRMLKMISIPLIVTSLLAGITGLGRAERLGKMFGRTLLYYLTTSLLAITVGLLCVNLLQPGAGGGAPAEELAGAGSGKGLAVVLFEQLHNMIPPNPFGALATGNFLSIIAFSLLLGIATILTGGTAAERLHALVDAAFQVMMQLTLGIIRLAPVGVFFLMLSVTATQGVGIFQTLGWYLVTVACALLVHAVIVLPLLLYFVAQRNPWQYARAMSPALLTAFSSASSNGTLPLTLTCVERRAGISNRVGSFVLPLGATVNMDGTALYEVVAVLFIAQITGHDLSLSQQVVVALTALLASIGAAGIPHAGLVMMVIILQAVGLPTESQGLIIAVDRVLDMGRTAVNVWSDSCGCAVISRWEARGERARSA